MFGGQGRRAPTIPVPAGSCPRLYIYISGPKTGQIRPSWDYHISVHCAEYFEGASHLGLSHTPYECNPSYLCTEHPAGQRRTGIKYGRLPYVVWYRCTRWDTPRQLAHKREIGVYQVDRELTLSQRGQFQAVPVHLGKPKIAWPRWTRWTRGFGRKCNLSEKASK